MRIGKWPPADVSHAAAVRWIAQFTKDRYVAAEYQLAALKLHGPVTGAEVFREQDFTPRELLSSLAQALRNCGVPLGPDAPLYIEPWRGPKPEKKHLPRVPRTFRLKRRK